MIPIAFPNGKKPLPEMTILAGDVGGTNARLALYRAEGEHFEKMREQIYASRKYPSLEEIILDFEKGEKPADVVSLGVAGPVMNGSVQITNLSYSISEASIREVVGIQQVYLINDLKSNAFGLAAIAPEDLMTLHEGSKDLKGNAALISPGTGLGEAGLFWDGQHYHPFATEGGHADYAPETEKDIGLLRYLQKKYGHVSWERVVSGMGIYEIYCYLIQTADSKIPDWLQQEFAHNDPAAAISMGAMDGDPICHETMQLFLRNLANEAANVVMKLNAFGGLFIGGGILPKNLRFLHQKDFVNYFLEAGRMGTLLKEVTLQIILNDRTALLGAAYYGAYSARPHLEK